ncbi:MAG: hypothetical protein ACKOWO_06520 [Sediminibacterium sp.]
MRKVYINFADVNFIKQQRFALWAAKFFGGFDKTIGLSMNEIDEDFSKAFRNILGQKRGAGYWLWKPYIIKKMLSELSFGDYLFYSDAGAFFLKNVDILIDYLERENQDIMGFELPLIEEQWTKRELFVNMKCDDQIYFFSNQILASFILIKKSVISEKFFEEFLAFACNEINITDKFDSSVIQSDDFIEHRHDQSIFSLLYKKYNFKPFKDPSQLGRHPLGYADTAGNLNENSNIYICESGRKLRIKHYLENYSLVLYHNKKGKPLNSLIRYFLKYILFVLKLFKGVVR